MNARDAGVLSIDRAWQSVSLEERLELISRAKAQGLMAGLAFVLLMGTVAYGFDKIWLLAGGGLGSTLIMPLFTSHSWRRGKPELILNYLAVRSVARRYAYGYGLANLDIIIIFRGMMEERFQSMEEEQMKKEREEINVESTPQDKKEVWICLMRGALVILSPRLGGAKLEFVAAVAVDLVCRRSKSVDHASEEALVIIGSSPNPGRTVVLTSNYPAALYVFEKQILRLIAEANEVKKRLQLYHESSV